ncbi:MAG: phosphoglycolate phosphatase [Roseibium sp.]
MKPILVFDLDGTLIDSAPDLHAAASRLLAREGLPPLSLETVRSFIGNGVPVLVERVMAATGLETSRRDPLVEAFLEDYSAHATDLTRPYSGVPETLRELQETGYLLGVLTNKPEAPARQILADLGLEDLFDAVVGGDSLGTRKPDPAGLRHLQTELGGGPVVFVGDSEVDAETAVRAGVPFALFSEGYRKRPVSELPHHVCFASFEGLPDLIDGLLERQD